jgi:hypothetical protein
MANVNRASLSNDALARSQPDVLEFWVQETAGTLSFIQSQSGLQSCLIHGLAAGDFTQAAADALLGVPNDVITATMFGSTAMGTDAYGFILACNGQVERVAYMEYQFWLASEVENLVLGTTTAPTNALTEVAYKTPAGNIAGRIIPAGFDAGTGVLKVTLGVYFK